MAGPRERDGVQEIVDGGLVRPVHRGIGAVDQGEGLT